MTVSDIEKMLYMYVVNLRFFHLTGGKCINGKKLERFWRSLLRSSWTNFMLDMFFSKITEKLSSKIKQKIKKKKKKKKKK